MDSAISKPCSALRQDTVLRMSMSRVPGGISSRMAAGPEKGDHIDCLCYYDAGRPERVGSWSTVQVLLPLFSRSAGREVAGPSRALLHQIIYGTTDRSEEQTS